MWGSLISSTQVSPVVFERCPKYPPQVEGTLSQGVRAFDLRHARYIGLAMQQVLTATVMNILRALHWLAGDRPTQTRSSAFAKLHAATA